MEPQPTSKRLLDQVRDALRLKHYSYSTQNQAFSALLFLYREVLNKDPGPVDSLRAKCPKRLPTVLTQEETRR